MFFSLLKNKTKVATVCHVEKGSWKMSLKGLSAQRGRPSEFEGIDEATVIHCADNPLNRFGFSS